MSVPPYRSISRSLRTEWCRGAGMSAGGNRRLARQGKPDVRLSLGFDDQFKPRFNTGGGRDAADVNDPNFVYSNVRI